MYIYVDWIQVKLFTYKTVSVKQNPQLVALLMDKCLMMLRPKEMFVWNWGCIAGHTRTHTHTLWFQSWRNMPPHLYPWRIPRHKLVGSGSSQVISWCLAINRWVFKTLERTCRNKSCCFEIISFPGKSSQWPIEKITRVGWVCPRPLGRSVRGWTPKMLPHKMDQTSGVSKDCDIFVAYVELFSAFQQGKVGKNDGSMAKGMSNWIIIYGNYLWKCYRVKHVFLGRSKPGTGVDMLFLCSSRPIFSAWLVASKNVAEEHTKSHSALPGCMFLFGLNFLHPADLRM